eukprot:1514966-Amphidinium_carterae.1
MRTPVVPTSESRDIANLMVITLGENKVQNHTSWMPEFWRRKRFISRCCGRSPHGHPDGKALQCYCRLAGLQGDALHAMLHFSGCLFGSTVLSPQDPLAFYPNY